MRYFWILLIAILVFLASSSGIAKIMKMPQDIDFFARYGFDSFVVMGFGVIQLIGAVLLVFRRTRVAGAVIIFLSFSFTLALLIMDKNVPFSIASIVAMIGLIAVAVKTSRTPSTTNTQ